MKIIFLTLLLFMACPFCKSQDRIVYTVNGSAETQLVKLKDEIIISGLSKEKNLQYRLVRVKLSFKKYDMKILKPVLDTVIVSPVKFSKKPVTIKPDNFPAFKNCDELIITVSDVEIKTKNGKIQKLENVLGKEKEFHIVKDF